MDQNFPPGYYYAHVPSLGLTTHGHGISGAGEAARDLVQLWIAEKQSRNESLPQSGEVFFTMIEFEDAV